MANVIGSVAIEIIDDSARFTQSMNRNAALVAQQSQRMSSSLGGVAKSVDDLNRKAGGFQPDAFRSLSLSALRAQNSVDRLQKSILAVTALAGGGFGTALLAKNLTDMADRYTNIQNRLATVVGTGKERVVVEEQIFDIANRTRSSYDETAKLFQRMSLASKTLGATQGQVLQVVETTQKALQAGGATGSEAASIATQLTQAFGSGNVAGDELRAIRENSTILAQAIADEFKVGVGELKKLGSEDQLPADRVFKAILRAGKAIDDQFASMTPTLAQAVVVLDNAFTRYIGDVDKSLGVTNAMAQGVIALANNLQTLGSVAAYAAVPLAAVFANRVAQRGLGAIAAPFQAERAVRAEALTKAEGMRDESALAAQAAQKALVETQQRAKVNPESFVESQILNTREALRKQLAIEDAAVLAAEEKYQAALRAAAQQGGAVATGGAALLPQREALRKSQTELRRAERGAEQAAANDAPARIQERLNASLEKEAALRAKVKSLAYEARSNLPETVGSPDEARVKGAARLLAVREQLNRREQESTRLAGEFAAAEQAAMAAAIAANERLVAAKAQVIASERSLIGAAQSRQNTAVVRDVLTAQAEADIARQRQQGTRQALGATEEVTKTTGAANAAKALADAQGVATTASGKLGEAQKVAAERLRETERGATLAGAAVKTFAGAGMSLYNFLGGGWGVLLTAAAVGFGLYEVAQARAEARTKEFNDAAEASVVVLKNLEEGYTRASAAAANAKIGTIQKEMPEQIQNLLDVLGQASGRMTQTFEHGIEIERFGGGKAAETFRPVFEQLRNLQQEGNVTKRSIDELVNELDRIGKENPDLATLAEGFRKLAEDIGKAAAAASQLTLVRDLKAAQAGEFNRGRDVLPPAGRPLANEAGDTDAEQKAIAAASINARVKFAEKAETERKRLVDEDRDFKLKEAFKNSDIVKATELTKAKVHEEFPTQPDEKRDEIIRERLKAGMDKAPKPKKPKETPEERLSERIARIREEAESSFLPEIDQEVIREITKTKGTSKIAGDVRKQLAAGQPLTGEFADLRSAQVARDAAKEYKNIVTEYGNMTQVTPFVRTEQEKLNFLLESGKINAMQAGLALADYMGKFKEFQWIDKLTDSLKGFGETLTDTLYEGKLNADTFADALNNLGKALFKLIINQQALEPLANMFKVGLANAFAPGGGGLAGLFGGGGGGGIADTSGDFAGVTAAEIMHKGGFVGLAPTMRAVPSALFHDAPHYKSGLRPAEFAAVLHQGEAVLTARQQMGMAAMAGGMANMKGGYNVVVNEAPGTQAQVSQGENGGLQIDILSLAEAGLADRMARGRGPLAKASRAGGRSNLRG